jgi:hypothetical protein
VLVLGDHRLAGALGSALRGLLPGVGGVGDPQGDAPHAVAVLVRVARDLAVGAHPAGEHVADVVLLGDPCGTVADLGLRSRIGGDPEPERLRVVVRGLAGVPHPELDVVDPQEGEEVVLWLRHEPHLLSRR